MFHGKTERVVVGGIPTVATVLLLPDMDDLRRSCAMWFHIRPRPATGRKSERADTDHHTWKHSAAAVAERIVEIAG